MTQIHESRPSAHPYIDTIWKTQNTADGVYLATPDGSWDLIVGIDEHENKFMMLAGQATKSTEIPYKAGTGSIVVSFKPGVYTPLYTASALLNNVEFLPNFDKDHFMLGGHTFAFPSYETAEELIEQLIELEILKSNEVITAELGGKPKAMSERAKQRHFSTTTGMTQKYLDQIRRAQLAVRLLQQGKKPSDVAAEAGYTDQPHMANSLKKIMTSKPSDIDHIHKV